MCRTLNTECEIENRRAVATSIYSGSLDKNGDLVRNP